MFVYVTIFKHLGYGIADLGFRIVKVLSFTKKEVERDVEQLGSTEEQCA
jgi:hypothetical protein